MHFRIFFALLAGTWSDHHGRKGLLLLSVFGQLLGSLSYGLNYIFLKELDWHFLFVELIIDICGGSVTYYMMEYSYMTDITQVNIIIILIINVYHEGRLMLFLLVNSPT